MHGLVFETSIWLLAGSTRLLTFASPPKRVYIFRKHLALIVMERPASAFSLAPNWITLTTGRPRYPELPQANAFLMRAVTDRTKARTLRHPHKWRTSNITHSFRYNNPFHPSLGFRFADAVITLLLNVTKKVGAARSAAIACKALNF